MNGPLTGYGGEQRGQEKWGKGAEVALPRNCLMEATCPILNQGTRGSATTKLSNAFGSIIGLYTHF